MRITHLGFQNFRSYESRYWVFQEPTTLIVGPNAAGKTSIIEAIYLLASGDSFRAGKIDETISFDQELGRVKGKIQPENTSDAGDENEIVLEVTITRGVVQGRRTHSRLFSVNDVRRQKKKFVGQLLAVVFRPEDMRLIEGSPPRRRRFLDEALSLLYPDYLYAVKTYGEALKKRNKLLPAVREREMPVAVLSFWNQQLVKHGEVIQRLRRQFLDHFEQTEFPLKFSVEYVASPISEQRITEYQSREILAGHTLIGPHKDDIRVLLDQAGDDQPAYDVSVFGSRGQQRMAVLWLKMSELSFMADTATDKPVLLLDDILSELDQDSRQLVLKLLPNYQTIVSTIDPDIEKELDQAKLKYETISLPKSTE